MDWARDYYTKQSEAFARAAITDSHRAIASRLDGWCRELPSCAAILELGAGNGGTAAALAELGRDVWAVEFNPSDATLARELGATPRAGAVHVVEADFYEVDLGRRFDFVFYWDGFGIGSDDDQRRLLRRIAGDWLAPGGRVIIDVFSPWNWARRAGETSVHTAKDGVQWERTVEFDALGSRLVDRWTPLPGRREHRSQTIRCYTLPEFVLLAEGTGLAVERFMGMDGRTLDPAGGDAATQTHVGETNGFFALLRSA